MTRVAGTLATLVVMSILVFALLYAAPGSVVDNIVGKQHQTPEIVAAVRQQYGLDDPIWMQYLHWLGRLFRGDLGESIHSQASVWSVFTSRGPLTFELCAMAFVMAVVVSVPLGVVSAVRGGGVLDRTIAGVSILGMSAPAFALGLLLLYAFAYYVPIFPLYGSGSGFLDHLRHLVLPAITLAVGLAAVIVKLTRTAMLRELDADYVTFARARGLPEKRVRRIALRNAAIPIVTASGLVLTYLVGGTILVETTFSLAGLGRVLEDAVLYKDFAVVQFLTLVVALVIAVIALVVDLLYLVLDPRLRTARR